MLEPAQSTDDTKPGKIMVRHAKAKDLPFIVALDKENTGEAKPDYWQRLFERFSANREGRCFLVAEDRSEGVLVGFIIGETRAWEFGSPPCGWIFALGVSPRARLQQIGTHLFDTICEGFRGSGINTVRTMLARDSSLVMSFFRSQGMTAGPFIQLEKELD